MQYEGYGDEQEDGDTEQVYSATRDALDAVVHKSSEKPKYSPPKKSFESSGRSLSQDHTKLRENSEASIQEGSLANNRKQSRVSFKESNQELSDEAQALQLGGSRSELVKEEKSEDNNTLMSKFTSMKSKRSTKRVRKRKEIRSKSPRHSRGQSSPT